jgi:sigma-B regulation protein RsbU (phosphoserine phosphatase)
MLTEPRKSQDAKQAVSARRYPSLRWQLIVAVNGALALLLCVFLAYDYQHQLDQCNEGRRISLEEEARTLLHAALQMRHHGIPEVQKYIDVVLAEMEHSHAPEHFIVLESESHILQSSTINYDSSCVIEAMRRAAKSPNQRSKLGDTELVVGFATAGPSTLYVAEDIAINRRAAFTDVSRRLLVYVVLGMAGALIVNLVLIRFVTHPLKQLVATIRQVAHGNAELQTAKFHTAEFNYLANEINTMISALAANDRARQMEMAKASKIQRYLLPKEIDVPGLRVVHLFQPADTIAGDYFDLIPLPDASSLCCVADVTGHGVPAALTAAMLKSLLSNAAEHHVDPAMILKSVNKRLISVTPTEHFATMILVRIDTQQHTLNYASAGHEAAWLLTADGELSELKATGMPIGIQENEEWLTKELAFAPGGRLLLVSDGIAETYNESRAMFGRNRVGDLLRDSKDMTVESLVARIDQELTRFRATEPQNDDITLLLIEETNDIDSTLLAACVSTQRLT